MATVQPAWRRKHSKTVKDHCPNSDSYRGSYFSNDWVSVFHFGLPLLCAAAVPLLCRCCLVSPPVSLHVSPRALHTIYGNSLFLPWNVANLHQRLRHAPLALYSILVCPSRQISNFHFFTRTKSPPVRRPC